MASLATAFCFATTAASGSASWLVGILVLLIPVLNLALPAGRRPARA